MLAMESMPCRVLAVRDYVPGTLIVQELSENTWWKRLVFLGDAGLSNLKCLCDPSEANLNNYVPKPPSNIYYIFSLVRLILKINKKIQLHFTAFFLQKTRHALSITSSMKKRNNANVRTDVTSKT